MTTNSDHTIAVVVPTLGTRPEFLAECVSSLRAAGDCYIALVRPRACSIGSDVAVQLDAQIDDPGTGLAAAINAGMASLPAAVRFATWLGDDDERQPPHPCKPSN